MICTTCQSAPAVVFIKQIVNHQVSQAALCASCAQDVPAALDPAEALLKLIGERPRPRAPARCPKCQTTAAQFRETGRFGCPHCYESFAPMVRELLPRVHAGSYEHRGKTPGT